MLEDSIGQTVLLRSPDATAYPYIADETNFDRRPSWFLANYKGLTHSGLLFTLRRHFAFLTDARDGWDAAFVLNDGKPRDDPWNPQEVDFQLRNEIWQAWDEFAKSNQAWFELHAVLPFDSVIEIDDIGDDHFEGPHVYATFAGDDGPFSEFRATVESVDRFGRDGVFYPLNRRDGRISAFKDDWREDGPWQAYSGYRFPEDGE